MTDTKTFDAWAIIELMGHDKIAGRITEQTIGGCHFLRVDVPEVNGNQAFTQCLGHHPAPARRKDLAEAARDAHREENGQEEKVMQLIHPNVEHGR